MFGARGQGPSADGRGPRADGLWPMADGRRLRAEGQGPRADGDGRGPMADGRLLDVECGVSSGIFVCSIQEHRCFVDKEISSAPMAYLTSM